MTLAEQTDLAELLAEKVRIVESKVKSGAANPAPDHQMVRRDVARHSK